MQLVSIGSLRLLLLIAPPLIIWSGRRRVSTQLPVNTQLVSVGLLFQLRIPPPCWAELPAKMQLVTAGLLSMLYIPPPEIPAELPLEVPSVNVGLLFMLNIPPPSRTELLLVNVHCVNAGRPPELYIAPPPSKVPINSRDCVELLLWNMQRISVGLPSSLYIPPPHLSGEVVLLALPSVIVKPLRTAVSSHRLPVTT